MFSLKFPNNSKIGTLFKQSKSKRFSYTQIASSLDFECPEGYWKNSGEIIIGENEEIFFKSKKILETFSNLRLPWVVIHTDSEKLKLHSQIIISTKYMGIWTTNVTRIHKIIDRKTKKFNQFGYIYGTVEGHSIEGEEIFLLNWNKETNEVSYKIFSFSRPKHILAKIMVSSIRKLQMKFRTDSLILVNELAKNA